MDECNGMGDVKAALSLKMLCIYPDLPLNGLVQLSSCQED